MSMNGKGKQFAGTGNSLGTVQNGISNSANYFQPMF